MLPLGLLVSRPRAGAGVSTLPRLVSVLLVDVAELGGEELQEADLQVHVVAVQVFRSKQHAADLLDDFLWESWENQVKAQPGVDHVMPVEGGLHQHEPGEGVLGPE